MFKVPLPLLAIDTATRDANLEGGFVGLRPTGSLIYNTSANRVQVRGTSTWQSLLTAPVELITTTALGAETTIQSSAARQFFVSTGTNTARMRKLELADLFFNPDGLNLEVGGDVSFITPQSPLSSLVVAAIQGRAVSTEAPSANSALMWSASQQRWRPSTTPLAFVASQNSDTVLSGAIGTVSVALPGQPQGIIAQVRTQTTASAQPVVSAQITTVYAAGPNTTTVAATVLNDGATPQIFTLSVFYQG
jgi:hypothetical protein